MTWENEFEETSTTTDAIARFPKLRRVSWYTQEVAQFVGAHN